MVTGLAHAAVCVPDVAAAARWYTDVLGLALLSPPYRMEGAAMERDMGGLVPSPVVVTAAIVGATRGDHVLELIEYPNAPTAGRQGPPRLTEAGPTHVGLVVEDLDATRARLEAAGVEFLVPGTAGLAGLRTTWCRDPWGTVLILMEKRHPGRPYWDQLAG